MESIIFIILGAVGLVLISVGVLNKKRKNQDLFYILGGAGLLVYSISLDNIIFIILQFVFVCAATFDLIKLKKRRK